MRNNALNFVFQLTRLVRGVTYAGGQRMETASFQLTRLVRGVTYRLRCFTVDVAISTHTPRERRDEPDGRVERDYQNFNSHAS